MPTFQKIINSQKIITVSKNHTKNSHSTLKKIKTHVMCYVLALSNDQSVTFVTSLTIIKIAQKYMIPNHNQDGPKLYDIQIAYER